MNRFRLWYQAGTRMGRPLILAHRGDSFHAPENTLEAARRGLDSGADGWELDVQLTSDGHAVVIHDASLLRTTDVSERFADDPRRDSGYLVSQFTLEEIQTLDAGSWFVDEESAEARSARGFGTREQMSPSERASFRSGAVRVPTLEEALAWTLAVNWLVNVEIKFSATKADVAARTVLAAIEKTKTLDHATISSFDREVMETVAELEPRVATGALISGPLDERIEAWVNTCEIDAIHGPPWFSDARSGRPRLVYTVNDAAIGGLAAQLARNGVTGLFTDDPRSMVRLFSVNQS